MIEQFWKGLTYTNARKVYGYSLACLACVCCWWVWKEFRPTKTFLAGDGSALIWQPKTDISALGFMERQALLDYSRFGDPFASAGFSPYRRPGPQPDPGPTRVPAWTQHTVPGNDVTGTRPSRWPPDNNRQPGPSSRRPVVSEKPTLGLVYHGRMIRTDGTTVALIENRTARKTSFYPEGASIGGIRLKKVGMNEIEVESDGETVTLALGELRIFEEF